MLIDYHLHNHSSPDSETDTETLIEEEEKAGIHHICITNHGEWFEKEKGIPGSLNYEKAIERFRNTLKEITELRQKFPTMQIGFGAEIQYEEQAMDDSKRLLESLPFDFVLGSIHNLDGINISGPHHALDFCEGKTEEKAYGRYFEELLKLVEWGHFDAVAHFDILKKMAVEVYGPFKPEKFKPIILKILKTMKKKGIGIELNTASLRKRCRELYPHPEILKWCVEIGIEHYTLGSDGHKADEYGRDLDKALQIAKEAGIKTLSTYKNHIPTKHPI